MLTRHPILFEDEWLIVIHKPSGALSHPNRPDKMTGSCAFEGTYSLDQRRFQGPDGPIWLIHRLDQETSGVLLAVKNESLAKICRDYFENNKIQKTYLALVSGKTTPAHGTWQDYLTRQSAKGSVRSAIRRDQSPNAILHYRVRQAVAHASLLEITLVTGRTHQIRVQAACRHHPVLGDRIYGNFPLNRQVRETAGLRRLGLHAFQLRFPHPQTGVSLTIEAPLPEDLSAPLTTLGFQP